MALPTGKEKVFDTLEIYDKAILFEFLEPPASLNASVLMRATYRNSHPLMGLGKAHPQAPPLHLHFSQSESFVVLAGRIATTTGYDCKDTIWTAANTCSKKLAHTITPWTPHRFWPVPPEHPSKSPEEERASKEDAVLIVWAHPHASGDMASGGADMDYLFFRNVVAMASDMHEGKLKANSGLGSFGALGSLFAMQEASDSTLVLLPGFTVLGGLRWWLPWKLQQGVAMLWWLSGGRKDGLLEAYMPRGEWEKLTRRKEI